MKRTLVFLVSLFLCANSVFAAKAVKAVVTGVKKNPALQVQKDAMNTARLIGAELGTTPISRSRPTLANSDDTDDLFDF